MLFVWILVIEPRDHRLNLTILGEVSATFQCNHNQQNEMQVRHTSELRLTKNAILLKRDIAQNAFRSLNEMPVIDCVVNLYVVELELR